MKRAILVHCYHRTRFYQCCDMVTRSVPTDVCCGFCAPHLEISCWFLIKMFTLRCLATIVLSASNRLRRKIHEYIICNWNILFTIADSRMFSIYTGNNRSLFSRCSAFSRRYFLHVSFIFKERLSTLTTNVLWNFADNIDSVVRKSRAYIINGFTSNYSGLSWPET